MKLAPVSGTTNNNETMFEAQYLLNGDDVYSPWMSRVGDNLLATVDTVGVDGTGTKLEVRVYHKNTGDVGDGAVLGALIEVASAGRAWEEYSGVKELVRYRFKLSDASPSDGKVLFRMLSPVWFDSVKA